MSRVPLLLDDALRMINWSYGRGEIIAIDHDRQTVTRKFQYGSDVRRYKIDCDRVVFLNHRRKLKED